MKNLHAKKSFSEFSDREIMFLILSNQVRILRQIQYLEQEVKNGKTEPLGHFSNTFKEMISNADSILKQSEEYLNQEDSEKGFLQF